ncbi:elongation of very long chain fatty acids protein AAEL008004 [Tetranychus urticae]|uniref:elongation of very long chain fatty acids protein AAEL008004 n=1 Tax=Tetranychus urticae TaxID=32264 RepID=UPI00077BCD1C|nr:elongation of very long chain fatty acids protein AAEL008004 [Tetranychus urticae]
MESVMGMIKYWCHDFWEIYGDHRISHLPLLKGGPWHVIGLTLFYLYFVKVMGPRMMKDRQPYELRGVMLAHNTFLVLLNGIGFLVGMWGTNWGLDTLKCRPFDPSSSATQDRILFYLGYTYYVSKFIDFLDTVYFVLRKKYSHITPLHVFHHTMMPFWCYIFFKFSSYTNNGFIPLINAFVHTVMYSYYALSALGPHMKPYLWWKKYITQLQLVQFCLATVHSLVMFADQTCTCSKFLISLQAAHGILFLFLFGDFYKKAYLAKKPSKGVSSKKIAAKVN